MVVRTRLVVGTEFDFEDTDTLVAGDDMHAQAHIEVDGELGS